MAAPEEMVAVDVDLATKVLMYRKTVRLGQAVAAVEDEGRPLHMLAQAAPVM